MHRRIGIIRSKYAYAPLFSAQFLPRNEALSSPNNNINNNNNDNNNNNNAQDLWTGQTFTIFFLGF